MPSSSDDLTAAAATNDRNNTQMPTSCNSLSSPTHTEVFSPSSTSQPRMRLRPFRLSDTPAFHLCLSDAETMRYESFLPHTTYAQTEEYIYKILTTHHRMKHGLEKRFAVELVVEVSDEVMKEVMQKRSMRDQEEERKQETEGPTQSTTGTTAGTFSSASPSPSPSSSAASSSSSLSPSPSSSSPPSPLQSSSSPVASPTPVAPTTSSLPSSTSSSSSSPSSQLPSQPFYHTVGKVVCYQASDLRYNIGYFIFRQYWRCGLATEAVGTLIEYVLKEKFDWMSEADQKGEYIWTDIDPRNIGSIDLLQKKFGFLLLGDAKNTMQVGEEWVDSVYLGVDRENFDKSQWKEKYLEQYGELPKIVL